MLFFKVAIITCFLSSVISHGNDEGRPKLLFIYIDEFSKELKSTISNKIYLSMNTSFDNSMANNLKRMIKGCEKNITRFNCSQPCLSIWSRLQSKNLKSALIGVPDKLVFIDEWPLVFYNEEIFKMGLGVVLKRVRYFMEHKKTSLVIMCIHGHVERNELLLMGSFLKEVTFNVIVVAPPANNSKLQIFIKGPSFETSISSQKTLRPVDTYLIMVKVFGLEEESSCYDGNQYVVSDLIVHHHENIQWTSFIFVVAICTTALIMSFIMIIMSVKGVFSRRKKSNRFNLGARIETNKRTRQVERNYLLESSDDEELFSGSSRDPRLPTVLKIDDTLSDIALH